MTFRDSYNLILMNRGGNSIQSTLNSTQHNIERYFKNDPTYRKGVKLEKPSNLEIDFRISNTVGSSSMDRNIDIKKMIFRPSATIYSGDYIKQADIYWLITECEHNSIQPKAIGYDCNNCLKFKIGNSIKELYCYFNNGTFTIMEDKIVKLNSNKLSCIIGTYYMDDISKYFKKAKTRFIINGNVYRIDGIDNTTGINKGKGIYIITFESDEIRPEDDLENGIAYNDFSDNPIEPQVYTIEGKDKIIKGIEETFKVVPLKTGISFQLDDWSTENNLAQIISQRDGSCIIKGLKDGEQVILSAKDGNAELCNKTISIAR